MILRSIHFSLKEYNLLNQILKDDKEVVLEAVKQDGYSFRYVSEHLRDDKDEVDTESLASQSSSIDEIIEL